jgi:hypothetical protein
MVPMVGAQAIKDSIIFLPQYLRRQIL